MHSTTNMQERFALKARDKILKHGRAITLFNRAATPTSHETHGLFLPPNQVRIFGLSALGEGTKFDQLFAQSEQIVIVYVETAIDIKQFSFVRDTDTTIWKVDAIQELKPAETRILAYIGTRR